MNKPGRPIQAIAGHLIDLVRIGSFHFRNPHSYTKFRQIKSTARRTGAAMMIETGTYRGVTTRRCSRVFERVFTIELDEALANEAKNYLAPRKNVEVIQGDSLKELPHIMAREDVNRVLVFLDGHFSGGITAHGDIAEPAVLELDELGAFRNKIRSVIIDDFRSFGTEEGFPEKSTLLRSIERAFPRWDIQVHLDQVIITPPNT